MVSTDLHALLDEALSAGYTLVFVDGRLRFGGSQTGPLAYELAATRDVLEELIEAFRPIGMTLPSGRRVPRQVVPACVTCDGPLPLGSAVRCPACVTRAYEDRERRRHQDGRSPPDAA